MRILELFKGTGSIGKAAEARGHEVVSLDIDQKTSPTFCRDITTWDYKTELGDQSFDVVWASPDCRSWSVRSYKHRTIADMSPKTEIARQGEAMIHRTLEIIAHVQPKYWFIENPRGRLRHFKPMLALPRKTVFYGDYGHDFLKATDIWTNCEGWMPRVNKDRKKFPNMEKVNNKDGLTRKQRRMIIPPDLCNEIVAAWTDH